MNSLHCSNSDNFNRLTTDPTWQQSPVKFKIGYIACCQDFSCLITQLGVKEYRFDSNSVKYTAGIFPGLKSPLSGIPVRQMSLYSSACAVGLQEILGDYNVPVSRSLLCMRIR